MANQPDLPEADLFRFLGLIEERLGLEFDPGENDRMAAVLRERMLETGCIQFSSYEQRVRDDSGEELRALAARLTVPETYFFRHHEKFAALTESVLPELNRAHPGRLIRILSAGCSTGEEPFTIAIALKETPGFDQSRVSITGIDVNPECIEKARLGRFPKWSMRTMPPEYLKKYFHPDGDGFVLDHGIRAMVALKEQNLAEEDPDFWRPNSYDVIFCANVLMYFSPAKRTETVARLARAIAPDGFLFLAHSETLLGVSDDFQLRDSNGCFYYRRRCPSSVGYREREKVAARERDLQVVRSITPPLLASGLLREAARAAARRSSTSMPETGPRIPAEFAPETGHGSLDFGRAVELVQAGQVQEALSVLQQLYPKDKGADSDVIILTAAVLAELERAEEAAQLCTSLLGVDNLNPSAHYLLGFCNEQRGWRAAAIASYRKAAHLDPTFAMPHLRLGLLFRREADLHGARHELAQAALLLAREGAARILLFGNGFSRATLINLCRSELRLCEGQP